MTLPIAVAPAGTAPVAIALVITQQFLFAIDMAAIHHLGGSLSLWHIAFVRSLGGLILALCLVVMTGRKIFYTPHPWVQTARAASSAAYTAIMIVSLAYIPLADATAISFLTALYVVLLAGPVLGEVIGWRRGVAVAIGLGGAVLIARPGFSAMSWFYLAITIGTILNALSVILTRYLHRDDSPSTILLYVQLLQFLVFCPAAFTPGLNLTLWPLMAVVAITGPLGTYCGIVAVRHAEASALAPYSYLRLALAVVAAPIIFGEWPGLASATGAAAIVIACVVVQQRQQRAVIHPPGVDKLMGRR